MSALSLHVSPQTSVFADPHEHLLPRRQILQQHQIEVVIASGVTPCIGYTHRQILPPITPPSLEFLLSSYSDLAHLEVVFPNYFLPPQVVAFIKSTSTTLQSLALWFAFPFPISRQEHNRSHDRSVLSLLDALGTASAFPALKSLTIDGLVLLNSGIAPRRIALPLLRQLTVFRFNANCLSSQVIAELRKEAAENFDLQSISFGRVSQMEELNSLPLQVTFKFTYLHVGSYSGSHSRNQQFFRRFSRLRALSLGRHGLPLEQLGECLAPLHCLEYLRIDIDAVKLCKREFPLPELQVVPSVRVLVLILHPGTYLHHFQRLALMFPEVRVLRVKDYRYRRMHSNCMPLERALRDLFLVHCRNLVKIEVGGDNQIAWREGAYEETKNYTENLKR